MTNAFGGLRRCLGLASVTGQAVASIGLTGTIVINIPAIYQTSGPATWLCYVTASAVVLLVALVLNLFARRASGPGALATYVELGLGRRFGVFMGVLLVLTYGGVLVCLIGGFADNALALAEALGFQGGRWLVPAVTVLCGAGCWFLARDGVKLSTILMLATEAVAIVIILILCGAILFHGNLAADASAFRFDGAWLSGIQAGLTLAILSFTGFESATTLGGESLVPQRTIPRAIVAAPVIAGLFFIFGAYVLVLGFGSRPASIAQADNAVEQLAGSFGLSGAGVVLAAGGCICFFGASLAILTALARILLFLGSSRVLPPVLGRIHERHQTPHVAISTGIVATLACALTLEAFGVAPIGVFSLMGTFATCGFLIAYFLIAVAAPFFLRKEGILTTRALALCGFTVLVILAAGIASVYPPEPGLKGAMPWAFAVLLVAGILAVAVAGGFRSSAEASPTSR